MTGPAPTCVPSLRPTCQDVCSLADTICGAADEICRLAHDLPGDTWAAGRCRQPHLVRARPASAAAADGCLTAKPAADSRYRRAVTRLAGALGTLVACSATAAVAHADPRTIRRRRACSATPARHLVSDDGLGALFACPAGLGRRRGAQAQLGGVVADDVPLRRRRPSGGRRSAAPARSRPA